MSIRHYAQQLELCPSTLWKILRKDDGLEADRIQLMQEAKPNENQANGSFVEWAQNDMATDLDFDRIVLNVEAHFWLNEYVREWL